MLEQRDLNTLKDMMESVVNENSTKLGTSILGEMDKRLEKTETSILDETERTRDIIEKQIERIQKNMEDLNQYYRITKLENDNTALLLKMIEELSKRVEDLEKKTA